MHHPGGPIAWQALSIVQRLWIVPTIRPPETFRADLSLTFGDLPRHLWPHRLCQLETSAFGIRDLRNSGDVDRGLFRIDETPRLPPRTGEGDLTTRR